MPPDVLSNDNDVLAQNYEPPTPPDAPTQVEPTGPDLERQKLLTQQRDESLKQSGEALKRAESDAEQEKLLASDQEKAMEPSRSALERSSRDLARAAANVPQQGTPPTPPKQGNEPGADENWLMTAGLLGAIAGSLSRRHATNALAAFTGAMEGYNAGSKQKFDQSMNVWEAENKKFLETEKANNDRYKAIMQSRELDVEQKRIAMQIEAARLKDQTMSAALATKNDLAIAQAHDKRADLIEKQLMYSEKLVQQRQQFDERERNKLLIAQMRAIGVNTDPKSIQARIDAIGQYRAAPIPGSRGTAIMAQVNTQYPEYNEAEWQKRRRADLVAGGAFGPMQYRQTASQVGVIDHLETLKQLGQALQGGDINVINRVKQRLAEETGNPVPPTFDAAKAIIGDEVIKAIIPTGGGVTDRQEIKHNLDRARSYPQLESVANIYQRLIAAQMKANGRLYQHATGGDIAETPLFSPRAKDVYRSVDDKIVFTHDDLQRSINGVFSDVQGVAKEAGTDVAAGAAKGTGMVRQGIDWLMGREKEAGIPQLRDLRPSNNQTKYPTSPTPDMPIKLPEGWNLERVP